MKTSLCLTIAVLGLAIINLSTATVQAEDYRYITNNGTITITGYTGIGGDVIIPDTIDELPVTALGYYAFRECTKLTSIAIGNSVTSVGSWAFSGCTSLTSVVIPKGLINIGAFAFSECSNLANIILPRSLTNIGLGAFNPCSGLVAAYFEGNAPSYESLFGESPFTGCTNAIYFLPGTSDWDKPWRRGFETVPSIIPKAWLLPYPVILTTAPNFGLQTNKFDFRISWATNASFVVEASTTLANPVWVPVSTNTLVDGWSDFRDSQSQDHPSRFYRIRSL